MEIKDNAKFCRYCGTKIETRPEHVKCPKCGAENRKGSTFCDNCGTKISANKTQNINSHPAKTTKKPSKEYKSSSSENSDADNSNGGNNLIPIMAIVVFIALIGIVAISSYQNDVNTPAIEITDISLIKSYTLPREYFPYDDPEYYSIYADDEIRVKEYAITFKALENKDDFVLNCTNETIKPGKPMYYSWHKSKDFNLGHEGFVSKPKNIEKGKTYKYIIAYSSDPVFIETTRKWDVDEFTFTYSDTGGKRTIHYTDINV